MRCYYCDEEMGASHYCRAVEMTFTPTVKTESIPSIQVQPVQVQPVKIQPIKIQPVQIQADLSQQYIDGASHKPSEMNWHEIKLACVGKKGQTVWVEHPGLSHPFRIQKFEADDTFINPGYGTIIRRATVNDVDQRPDSTGALTLFFKSGQLSSGVKFATLKPGEKFKVQVEFLQDCEWSVTASGWLFS
jgi:hypothetical protein